MVRCCGIDVSADVLSFDFNVHGPGVEVSLARNIVNDEVGSETFCCGFIADWGSFVKRLVFEHDRLFFDLDGQ